MNPTDLATSTPAAWLSWPPWVWVALMLSWLVASVVYRRQAGKPMFAAAPPDAGFSERWVSARMGTGLVARLGTARHCMHVQVSQRALRIHPHFPFTLAFMPELYDLDHVIPLPQVLSATILSDGRVKAVEVRYTRPDGSAGTAQLLLRQAEAFTQAVSGA